MFLKIISTIILSLVILGNWVISLLLSLDKEKQYKHIAILLFSVGASLIIPIATIWAV